MDVREIVISEFKAVFSRHGYTTPQDFLIVAESPFNLDAVQRSIDQDLQKIRDAARIYTQYEQQRQVDVREKYHEEELRKLSREYAIKILQLTREGRAINESMVLLEQRSLKNEIGARCDVYPCA